jgi:hypothetical protein
MHTRAEVKANWLANVVFVFVRMCSLLFGRDLRWASSLRMTCLAECMRLNVMFVWAKLLSKARNTCILILYAVKCSGNNFECQKEERRLTETLCVGTGLHVCLYVCIYIAHSPFWNGFAIYRMAARPGRVNFVTWLVEFRIAIYINGPYASLFCGRWGGLRETTYIW